jgi:hypothetical protein
MMADGGCIGRTYGIDAMSLARHISDMAQHLTQTYGRMLLVSFGGSFPRGRGRGGGICGHGRGGNVPSRIDTFHWGVVFTSYFWRNRVLSQSAQVPVPLFVPPPPQHQGLRLGRVVRLTLQGAEVLGSNPPPCGLVRSLTSQFVFSTRVSISSHSCLPQRSKEICVRAFARLKWGLCAFYALEVVFPLQTPRTVARCAAR